MQMKYAMVGLTLLLGGCASTAEQIKPVVYHPPLPETVETYKPEWRVILDEGKPYVAMSYDDSVRYRIWLERVFGYVKKQNEVICHYRKDLKEPKCVDVEDGDASR
ncbi:PseT.2 conserved hypothetical protein [Aeromonas phage phiAS5]|uniref:O-spanin n=1 Tax=Aeromonas phage phiAS5 TaxID=879630 RepID=E1A2G4_9CAUD|nr:Rz-like spanin [Aeromonas phage phiAS5]ADM79910.1 PseT.2 conserved hypothetical protein [Aeromonas phage phiAS5]BES53320.1 hypothetical protein [Aeromonas phage phiWae14]